MRILESGMGEWLQPIDLDEFREWNREKKVHGLVDKLMTEQEAISRFVYDGCYIGTELYGTVRCPMSLAREVVRQGKVDFITAPGYLTGPGAREAAGLPPGTGPYRVVSTLALLDFEEETKRMRLLATNPGVTVEQVIENTGFELIIPEHVGQNEPPTEEELRILREEVDPERFYI